MRTKINVYGLPWGKSSGLGPESNLARFFINLNTMVVIVLIIIGLFTYEPKSTLKVTDQGKRLLGVGAVVGLICAVPQFIDAVIKTKTEKVNPQEPYKIRTRVAKDFAILLRIV